MGGSNVESREVGHGQFSEEQRAAEDDRALAMPKGSQGERRPADVVGCAVTVARIATGEIGDTRLQQPAKRKADLAGGKPRAEKLTEERRNQIAAKAASERWG